jgi:hypothetical protein
VETVELCVNSCNCPIMVVCLGVFGWRGADRQNGGGGGLQAACPNLVPAEMLLQCGGLCLLAGQHTQAVLLSHLPSGCGLPIRSPARVGCSASAPCSQAVVEALLLLLLPGAFSSGRWCPRVLWTSSASATACCSSLCVHTHVPASTNMVYTNSS